MLKALLFDLDGTLSHTDPVHYDTWFDLLLEYGIEINPDLYKTHFSGRLNEAIVRDLLPQLSPQEGIELSDRKEAEFRRRAATQLRPLPGLRDVLAWMEEQQLLRAIVTNAPRANAEFMVQVLQVQSHFPLVILGDELERGKPDPLPYQVALERLGVQPDEALVFEDSPSGLQAAIAAGIPSIGVATSQPAEILQATGAKFVISDFCDRPLWELLEQLSHSSP
jgi:HAD superfamily hydrolase (TIGR01509 family)